MPRGNVERTWVREQGASRAELCGFSLPGQVNRTVPTLAVWRAGGPKGLGDVAQSRTFRKKLGRHWGKGASEPSFVRGCSEAPTQPRGPVLPRLQSWAAEKPNGVIRLTSSMKGQGHPVRAGT